MEKVISKKLKKACVEDVNICNILPRTAISNGFKTEKRKYRVHVYFKSVCLHIIYEVLWNFKMHSLKIFLLQRSFKWGHVQVLSIVEIEEENESITEKIFLMEKKWVKI